MLKAVVHDGNYTSDAYKIPFGVILYFNENIILSSSFNSSKANVAIVRTKSNKFFLEPCLVENRKQFSINISAVCPETDLNSNSFTLTPVSGKK